MLKNTKLHSNYIRYGYYISKYSLAGEETTNNKEKSMLSSYLFAIYLCKYRTC